MSAAILYKLTYAIPRFQQLAMIDPKAARTWVVVCDPPFPTPLNEPLQREVPPPAFERLSRVTLKAEAYIASIGPFLQANWVALNVSLAHEIEKLGHDCVDSVSLFLSSPTAIRTPKQGEGPTSQTPRPEAQLRGPTIDPPAANPQGPLPLADAADTLKVRRISTHLRCPPH